MDEVQEIESRLEKAKIWFDEHAFDETETWNKAFELFRSLLKRRAELYLENKYEQKNMFSS